MPSLEAFLRDLVREPPPSLRPSSPEAVDVVVRTITLRCTHGFCGRSWRVPIAGLPSTKGYGWACPGCKRTLQACEVEVVE